MTRVFAGPQFDSLKKKLALNEACSVDDLRGWMFDLVQTIARFERAITSSEPNFVGRIQIPLVERPTNDELGELKSAFTAPSSTAKLVNKLVDYVRDEKSRGLTHTEIEVACRNVGIDLSCGACATLFYTGTDAEDLSHSTNCPRQEQLHKNVLDGRYDVARVLVEKVFGNYYHHPPYTDVEQEIVDDPYVGVEAALNEYDRQLKVKQGRPIQAVPLSSGEYAIEPSEYKINWLRYPKLGEIAKTLLPELQKLICDARADAVVGWRPPLPNDMPQTRQGNTDGGLPSMPGAAGSIPSDARVWSALARQCAQLLNFATRFALELRKHGTFGMNRDEGELLKEFDEWMLANPFSERGQP
jgi:hypothetical protein